MMNQTFKIIKFASNLLAHIGLLLLSPLIGQKEIASFIAKKMYFGIKNEYFLYCCTVALIIAMWAPALYLGTKFHNHLVCRDINLIDQILFLITVLVFILATVLGLFKILSVYGKWIKHNLYNLKH